MTATRPVMPSGFSTLDGILPAGGWPVSGVTEIFTPSFGIGELRLLAPVLRQLTHGGRTVALLVPASLSYAPTLIQHGVDLQHVKVVRCANAAEGLAAVETRLQNGDFAALVAWAPANDTQDANLLRMLQLAARLSHCPVFVFSTLDTGGRWDPGQLSNAQVHLRIESITSDTIRLHRLEHHLDQILASLCLTVPAARTQVRTMHSQVVPSVPQGLLDQRQRAAAPRRTLRASLLQFASVLAAKPDVPAAATRAALVGQAAGSAPPSRSSWPFKQRKPAPKAPGLPVPTRLGRSGAM